MGLPVLKTLYFVVMTIGEKDTKAKKEVTENTLRVFESDQFKKDLQDRVLFGFPSHYDRRGITKKQKETKLPYFDLVIDSGNYCNVITGCRRIGDSIVLKIDIYDNEAGRKIVDLHDSGTSLKVSLAMTSNPSSTKEWEFYRVMGLDFTTLPAFKSAHEVEEHFSAEEDIEEDTDDSVIYFSGEEVHEDEEQLFSEEDYQKILADCGEEFGDLELFSVQDVQNYIKESHFTPAMALYKRIQSVIQYINGTKEDRIRKNLDTLKTYIRTYILNYINAVISSDKSLSIIIGLKLNQYLRDLSSARRLQIALTKARTTLKKDGTMTLPVQKELNDAFGKMFNEIFTNYIGKKVASSKAEALKG